MKYRVIMKTLRFAISLMVTIIVVGAFTACSDDDIAVCSDADIDVSSITLDKESVSLSVGSVFELVATIVPENATNKTIVWSSSDASIATVDGGKVTALSRGNATITAKADIFEAKCYVKVITKGFVDLGMPSGTYWAECNLGATKPEEYGDYYAWGETEPKDIYLESNSITWCKNIDELVSANIVTPAGIDRDGNPICNLTAKHDAASVNLGGKAHMPTLDQIKELKRNCDWEWTETYGAEENIAGCIVKSKKNGNSIFIPASGSQKGLELGYVGRNCSCWSASAGLIVSEADCFCADEDGYFGWGSGYRHVGHTIRPVSE